MSRPDEKASFCRSRGSAYGCTCAQTNAEKSTQSAAVGRHISHQRGALTIQARQLNIVGEEERKREAEKEEEEAKKIKLGDKAANQSC